MRNASSINLITAILLTGIFINIPYSTLTLFSNSSSRFLLTMTIVYILGLKAYIITLAGTPFRVSLALTLLRD